MDLKKTLITLRDISKGKINLPFLNTSLSLSSDIAPLSSSDTVGKDTLRLLSFGTKEENLFYLSSSDLTQENLSYLSSSDLTQENLSYLSSSDTGQRNFLPLSSSDLIRRSIKDEDNMNMMDTRVYASLRPSMTRGNGWPIRSGMTKEEMSSFDIKNTYLSMRGHNITKDKNTHLSPYSNLSYLSSSDTGQRNNSHLSYSNHSHLSSSDLIRRSIESEDDILSNSLLQKTKHNINSNNLSKKKKYNISSNNLSQPKNITYTQTTYLNRKDTI